CYLSSFILRPPRYTLFPYTTLFRSNILKSTSGLFLKIARDIAKNYPSIETNEMIVDNACMQLVMNPHQFDVIVTTNLFGDIISEDRKSTRLNSSHVKISYAVFCLKK